MYYVKAFLNIYLLREDFTVDVVFSAFPRGPLLQLSHSANSGTAEAHISFGLVGLPTEPIHQGNDGEDNLLKDFLF